MRKIPFKIISFALVMTFSSNLMAWLRIDTVHHQYTRSYYYYVPDTVLDNAPLVIALHPWVTPVLSFINSTKGMELAREKGFVIAWPQGLFRWNAGPCCMDYTTIGRDDVGYIRKVVKDMQGKVNIDQSRIYATGYSNGAAMTHRLAMEASDVFAAVGTQAFHLVTNEPGITNYNDALKKPDRAIPVMQIHANGDDMITYPWGEKNGTVTKGFKKWAEFNGCSGDPVVEGQWDENAEHHDIDNFYAYYDKCKDGVRVEQIVMDGGHVTPGISAQGLRRIWAFLQQWKHSGGSTERPDHCKLYDRWPAFFSRLKESCTG